MDKTLLYYIWFSTRLYPGNSSAKLLLERYEDIAAIYNAARTEYEAAGVPHGDAVRLADKNLEDAARYYDYCEKEHIGILTYDNPYYPGRLKAINDPPPLLYYRGRVNLLDDYPCFAMVGTRSCSERGFRTAYRTAFGAASGGAVIVNGLALGTDTACMRGALDAGGYAVGLLGCGIDRIYPAQNTELFCRLSRQGLILSEFAPFTRPDGHHFPVRNRVISGLSVAAVIFEADEGSGALITASHALSQGRKLFAVPGDVNDRLYGGPLGLIKEGAQIVTDADDILTEYSLMFPHRIHANGKTAVPPEFENAAVNDAFSAAARAAGAKAPRERRLPKPPRAPRAKKANGSPDSAPEPEQTIRQAEVKRPPEPMQTHPAPDAPSSESKAEEKDLSLLSPEERKLYAFFEKQPVQTVDELVARGLKTDDVLSSLTLLEVYGFVRILPGGRYEKL